MEPIHVAAYSEEQGRERSAPTVKQHLACIRMVFDWLVTGQVMPSNPAHAVRGLRHSVSKGATTVISPVEARDLLDSMGSSTLAGLRDRAIVATMALTFARSARSSVSRLRIITRRKKSGGCGCARKTHGQREALQSRVGSDLDAYIEAAGIAADRKGPLLRGAIGRTGQLSERLAGKNGCLVYGTAAGKGCRAGNRNRLPYLPRYGHHGLSNQWRPHRSLDQNVNRGSAKP